jgi:cell fate regulator YaaT (PSP1 superfamily)
MSCKSCTSGGCGSQTATDGKAAGCNNNGACGTGGCNKMNVFDWLSHMDIPTANKFDIVEVKFKGGRKEYYKNTSKIELHTGDPVVVDVSSGHSIGVVSLQGELVRLQMLKKSIKNDDSVKAIYRIANDKDLEKHEQAIARDAQAMYRTRELIADMKLNMKLSDVEFQSDNTKATFYYSSEDRVDFRELIKMLAGEFKVRIEMKQISLRQEAARIGGIGICGRELCCSTWLNDFKNVNTSAARYQNLSLNPVKLSGQCGRLKCCLNYELQTYMEALKHIPTIQERITIARGQAYLQKTDIFRKLMWFSFDKDDNWYSTTVDRVVEIIELNKKGIIPSSFDDLREQAEVDEEMANTSPNSDLARLDKKYSKKKKPKPKPNKGPRPEGAEARADRPEGEPRPDRGPRPEGNRPPRPERERGNRPDRPIRPEGEARPDRGPRPESDTRPQNPRFNNNRPQGPRPEADARPRPEGTPQARPEGENRNNNNKKNKFRNRPKGPRPESGNTTPPSGAQ